MNNPRPATNALIKHVIRLQEKSTREVFQECIVEGIRAITTFIEAQKKLKYIFITPAWSTQIQQWAFLSEIYQVSEGTMQKISSLKTPSGILGVFEIPSAPPLTINNTLPPLVCAQISDPGNLGTLIRSAAAFNKKDIVLVEGVDPWNTKVIQASAGTIALVNIYTYSWQEIVSLKKYFTLSALVPQNGKTPDQIDYKKTILIIGNEAHGLPSAWQKECNELITLPMPGGTESLNAAIAGSIIMYLACQSMNK